MKAEPEGSSMHYLVHYAGWNVRYDEWVTKDRVFAVVELGKPSSVERPPVPVPSKPSAASGKATGKVSCVHESVAFRARHEVQDTLKYSLD